MKNKFRKSYLEGQSAWVPDRNILCVSAQNVKNNVASSAITQKVLPLFSQCRTHFQFVSDRETAKMILQKMLCF